MCRYHTYSQTNVEIRIYNRKICRRDYAGVFEGFVTASDSTLHIFIPDYQGNITGVYNSARNCLEQFTDYYPYGLPHASATSPSVNRRKYGGKELTTDCGLNLCDFSARWHNPAFPAFTTPDPMADTYTPLSPYTYCGGDPINQIDPTGKDFIILIAPEGASSYGHMGAIIQNKKGNYFYITAGANEAVNFFSVVSNSNIDGGMMIKQLESNSNKDAIEEVKSYDTQNSEYTDYIVFDTSKEIDDKIYDSAVNKQKDINNKNTYYRVLTNNCADIIEDVIEKGTGIDLPTGLSPSPNTFFNNIIEQKDEIQKKLDEIQKKK